jgi:hypothetical protein
MNGVARGERRRTRERRHRTLDITALDRENVVHLADQRRVTGDSWSEPAARRVGD